MNTKTIFITGGSRGIGEAVVREAIKTYNVVFTYCKNKEKAESIVKELESQGGIIAVQCDLKDEKSIKSAVDVALKRFSKIDILINNAGISKTGLFIDLSTSDWEEIRTTNLDGQMALTKLILNKMLEKKEGSIVNVASIWGQVGASMEVAYSTTKAGIIGFTKALAKEVALSGIRVNAVAPGAIDTDMMKEYSKEEIDSLCKEIPLGRLGTVEEVAKAIMFLAKADYITGEVLSINGGWN